VHAIVRATFDGVIVPSAVTTGVPGDHVSWSAPFLSMSAWLENEIGAGYCAVAHALTSIDGDTNWMDHCGGFGPLLPPLV
jgi:hypothetical protein